MLKNDKILELIKSRMPNRYLQPVDTIALAPLKNKFTDRVWKNRLCTNVNLVLRVSAYHPVVSEATICRLIDGYIYFSDLGKSGIFDPEQLPDSFDKVLLSRLESLFPGETFGCCSSYKKCSNAKHCVHEDPYFANSCMYKKNLEAGIIFYGGSRNV